MPGGGGGGGAMRAGMTGVGVALGGGGLPRPGPDGVLPGPWECPMARRRMSMWAGEGGRRGARQPGSAATPMAIRPSWDSCCALPLQRRRVQQAGPSGWVFAAAAPFLLRPQLSGWAAGQRGPVQHLLRAARRTDPGGGGGGGLGGGEEGGGGTPRAPM